MVRDAAAWFRRRRHTRASDNRSRAARLAVLGALAASAAAFSPLTGGPALAGDTIDGAFEGAGIVAAGTETQLTVAGRGGVPANATAVALNLTVTGTTGSGFATVYPCGTPRPTASNINYTAGATIANSVITKLGANGKVCVYTQKSTHLITDVSGHFTGNGYNPLNPARLLDTRPGAATFDGTSQGAGIAAVGTETQLTVAGRGGVPANATAVALNLTVTGTTGSGFATVYPCGTPRPTASNINYTAGATIANSVITKLGANGKVCVYTQKSTHLITDVSGHFTGNGYNPLNPARLLDTRPGAATFDGTSQGAGIAAAGTETQLTVAGRGGVPANATAVALNLTVTGTTGSGFATVYPCGTPRPTASNINYTAGATIANSVITKLGANGKVCVYTQKSTHLITDVSGHFTGNGYNPLNPARLLDTRPSAPPPPPPPPPSPAAVAEALSLQLVNQQRASLGLGAVALDANMSAFARDWSQNLKRVGLQHSSGPWSENIVIWKQPSLTPEQAAAGFHQAWVASAPHYANMTNPNWRRVGVGIYHDETGWYGTHEFTS